MASKNSFQLFFTTKRICIYQTQKIIKTIVGICLFESISEEDFVAPHSGEILGVESGGGSNWSSLIKSEGKLAKGIYILLCVIFLTSKKVHD